MSLDRVCIVGGGPAGMAMARAMLRHSVPFHVFERHNDVGGLWYPDSLYLRRSGRFLDRESHTPWTGSGDR
jgi:cation diffusion facilitator CzcD-associated flavoprotein CzcO